MSLHADPDSIMVANGLGGSITLYRDRLVIARTGLLHVVMDAVFPHHPRVDTTIFLDDITAISIVRPMLMVEYVRFVFAGETPPDEEEGYWSAAFADNAVMMNLFDNRAFYTFVKKVEELRARAVPGRGRPPRSAAPPQAQAPQASV
jgi:hypothetical protein